MNLLVLHAHWNNRGDEAALRAFIDNFLELYPDSQIRVQIISKDLSQFGYENDDRVSYFSTMFGMGSAWRRKNYPEIIKAYLTKGKLVRDRELKDFIDTIRWCDIAVHAPGGPSIGEIYRQYERFYLWRFLYVKRLGKPYMFYAPSAGPFHDKFRNIIRRYIYNHAADICLREGISAEYIRSLGVSKELTVTLDSAMQRDVDVKKEQKVLEEYDELNAFLQKYPKIIGITTSDLTWNSQYANNAQVSENIADAFKRFIQYAVQKGYGILFIPQLFGIVKDRDYMASFATEHCFVMDDVHDCYFQQYIIGKLYAVVGMRYHSNVFSAKMSTPFVSISYEQKMLGFMKKIGLEAYCIPIGDLNYERLVEKFEQVEQNHDQLKEYLQNEHETLKQESYETTRHLIRLIERK